MNYKESSTKELLVAVFDLIPEGAKPDTTHRINLIDELSKRIDKPVLEGIKQNSKAAASSILTRLNDIVK